MALSQYQQIKQLVDEAKTVLITFHKQGSTDAIAGAAALMLYLTQRGKRVDVVVDEFQLPRNLRFLRKAKKIKSAFSHLQKFMITMNVGRTGVKELSYDMKDEKLRIFVTPKEGFLTRKDIQTAQTDFAYDLIITLDTPDLSSLGSIYENNTALFQKLPLINIDVDADNERYGSLNVVDPTMSANTELLYHILLDIGEEYMHKRLATALLAGMIGRTRSFQTDNVKPQTLEVASKLIRMGADREYIIKNLYQTKTVPSLKLWGQALTHLQSDPAHKLVWTTITRENFARSGAVETDLYNVVDELISNSPEADLILLMHEHQSTGAIHAVLSTTKEYNAKTLLSNFSPTGDDLRASVLIEGKSLKDAEHSLIETIKKTLSSR